MGGVSDMLDEVASLMGLDDPNDPKVRAEVERRLSLNERRFIVLETHPNLGGAWVGMLGSESQVMLYLYEQSEKGNLEDVLWILELRDKADEETDQWIEFEECQPIRITIRPPKGQSGPTPPLPGIEKRLAEMKVHAYGVTKSALDILNSLYDAEVEQGFSDLLEELVQSDRLEEVSQP